LFVFFKFQSFPRPDIIALPIGKFHLSFLTGSLLAAGMEGVIWRNLVIVSMMVLPFKSIEIIYFF